MKRSFEEVEDSFPEQELDAFRVEDSSNLTIEENFPLYFKHWTKADSPAAIDPSHLDVSFFTYHGNDCIKVRLKKAQDQRFGMRIQSPIVTLRWTNSMGLFGNLQQAPGNDHLNDKTIMVTSDKKPGDAQYVTQVQWNGNGDFQQLLQFLQSVQKEIATEMITRKEFKDLGKYFGCFY